MSPSTPADRLADGAAKPAVELDPRDLAVLHRIVEAYIDAGEPVSSAEVKRRGIDASSATIRKVMADLETAGLLEQPHASAGRVPTARAMRLYVSSGVNPRLHPWDRTRLEEVAATAGAASLPASLGQRLAGLSGQLAFVAVPRFVASTVQEIGLVRVADRRLLAYFVSPGGLVQQKVVDLDFDPTAAELTYVQNFLNERLAHRSLAELRRVIHEELTSTSSSYDRLQRTALEIGARALPSPEVDVYIEGAAKLAEQPEFADRDKLQALLLMLEDRRALLQLVERVLDGQGVQVVLGLEPLAPIQLELACVGTHCADTIGLPMPVISLLGPTRMDYGRVMPLVDYAARLLGRHLQRS